MTNNAIIKNSRRGAAGSQYALVLGLIGIVAIAAITIAGREVKNLLTNVSNRLSGVENISTSSTGSGSGNASTGSSLYAWGYNSVGQLGTGNTTNSSTPIPAAAVTGSNYASMGVSEFQSCAIVDGAAKCWGSNNYGQLGNGTTGGSSLTPVNVSGIAGTPSEIYAGIWMNCALSGGRAYCWGLNSSGQLGLGDTTNRNSAVELTLLGTNVSKIATYYLSNCAIVGGAAKCWGASGLGVASPSSSSSPVTVSGLTANVTDISTGDGFGCAIMNSTAYCWGNNASGQLGTGNTTASATPVTPNIGGNAVRVSTGSFHSCAAMSAGGVKCWGGNDTGQLGNGTCCTNSSTPATVIGTSAVMTQLVSGERHACALSGSILQCWGSNYAGQIGTGSCCGNQTTAYTITGLPAQPLKIAAGSHSVMALFP